MYKKIFTILIIIFIFHLFFRIYQFRNLYMVPYNADYWKTRYENSQWSTKRACPNLDPHVNPYTCIWDDNWNAKYGNDTYLNYLKKEAIGDDGVYTYAGWEYVHGHDPTTLNAEIPPFGKYLIGLSEITFNNQNIFALISGLFVLVALFLLNTTLFKSKLLAFLPVFLFSLDPLFYTQLGTTLLDSLYLGLLLLIFYFYIKKNYIASAICLGLMAATKSPLSTFLLVIGVLLIYIFYTSYRKQPKILLRYIIILPLAFIIFTLTYFKFFLSGHSFRAFLGVQKWIVLFYSSGAKGSFISPWEMVFTGKWHTWWGTYVPFYQWHIGWPILFFLFFTSVYVMIRSRYIKPMVLLVIWTITYFLFLCFIPTWPRYLLLVLPFLYNLSIWLLLELHIFSKLQYLTKEIKKYK